MNLRLVKDLFLLIRSELIRQNTVHLPVVIHENIHCCQRHILIGNIIIGCDQQFILAVVIDIIIRIEQIPSAGIVPDSSFADKRKIRLPLRIFLPGYRRCFRILRQDFRICLLHLAVLILFRIRTRSQGCDDHHKRQYRRHALFSHSHFFLLAPFLIHYTYARAL